ncbi:MAG: cytochrome c biogenesis CcdA family protein [Acidimicrobiales bacterium]
MDRRGDGVIDAPIALAFTAGLVATVNPCGFAMLPAYLSWYLGAGDEGDRDHGRHLGDRFARALVVGVVVAAGFLVVFGITGTLITVGVRSFIDYVPWVALLIGVLLAALGVALLAGRQLTVALPKPHAGIPTRRIGSMFAFGASYAVASLSCTLPVFLAVVASTFTRSDVTSGVAAFVAYALGMSVVLLMITLALAVAEHSLLARIRSAARYVNRAAGGLLVVAGGYIVYYWAFNLSTDPGETTGAEPARFVERLSAQATALINDFGWQTILVAAAAVLAVVATVVARSRSRPAQPASATRPEHRHGTEGRARPSDDRVASV